MQLKKEMDDLYAKPDFSDADSNRVGELQIKYEEMNGWNAESDAATLLSNLDIDEAHHYTLMKDLDGKQKSTRTPCTSLIWNSRCAYYG